MSSKSMKDISSKEEKAATIYSPSDTNEVQDTLKEIENEFNEAVKVKTESNFDFGYITAGKSIFNKLKKSIQEGEKRE